MYSNKALILNSHFFVVLVREPSKSKRGTGFCGSGFEDYLLLIEAKSKRLSLLDNILLQSCLDSQELASDKGAEFLRRAGDRLEPQRRDAFQHVGQPQILHDLAVELRDDRRRRARGNQHAVPGGCVESRQTGFGDRRQLGHGC